MDGTPKTIVLKEKPGKKRPSKPKLTKEEEGGIIGTLSERALFGDSVPDTSKAIVVKDDCSLLAGVKREFGSDGIKMPKSVPEGMTAIPMITSKKNVPPNVDLLSPFGIWPFGVTGRNFYFDPNNEGLDKYDAVTWKEFCKLAGMVSATPPHVPSVANPKEVVSIANWIMCFAIFPYGEFKMGCLVAVHHSVKEKTLNTGEHLKFVVPSFVGSQSPCMKVAVFPPSLVGVSDVVNPIGMFDTSVNLLMAKIGDIFGDIPRPSPNIRHAGGALLGGQTVGPVYMAIPWVLTRMSIEGFPSHEVSDATTVNSTFTALLKLSEDFKGKSLEVKSEEATWYIDENDRWTVLDELPDVLASAMTPIMGTKTLKSFSDVLSKLPSRIQSVLALFTDSGALVLRQAARIAYQEEILKEHNLLDKPQVDAGANSVAAAAAAAAQAADEAYKSVALEDAEDEELDEDDDEEEEEEEDEEEEEQEQESPRSRKRTGGRTTRSRSAKSRRR